MRLLKAGRAFIQGLYGAQGSARGAYAYMAKDMSRPRHVPVPSKLLLVWPISRTIPPFYSGSFYRVTGVKN